MQKIFSKNYMDCMDCFEEELDELFRRYSTKVLTPDVMRITQKLLKKYFSLRNNHWLQHIAEQYLKGGR